MEWLGPIAFIFSLVGLAAYQRIDRLEKRLKELELIESDFDSEASDDPPAHPADGKGPADHER